jgi:GntR family phosphonate transport system transcriptional regulator
MTVANQRKRRSRLSDQGITLWRQIGESLTQEIESGHLATDQRLPSSEALASRFGVNRHTVRKAIAHLQAEGKVRIERGRGTYAVVNPLNYNLGPRQLFEQNLANHNLVPSRTVIAVVECHPPAKAAEALEIPADETVVLVTILGEADGSPINYGHHYVVSSRLPGIAGAFRSFLGRRQTFSFTSLFEACGNSEYRRRNVRIRSRLPENEEARHLNIASTEFVLVTEVTSVGDANKPLTHAETCFASSRVELTINFLEHGQ